MLSQEMSEFIESGVAMMLACRDRHFVADGARVIGAVVGLDHQTITVYIQREAALRILPILEETKEFALAIALPTTYRAMQLKGSYLGNRPADARDRLILERHRELFHHQVKVAGIPVGVAERISWWPALALELEIREVYNQTPGPKAGEKLR